MAFGGNSGARGILFFDGKKESRKSVYGYYEGDEIVLACKGFDENMELKKYHDKEVAEGKNTGKWMVRIFILYIIFFAASIVMVFKDVISLYEMAVGTVFLIGTFLPLISLIVSFTGLYRSKEVNQQFRRFHGAEHKVLNCHIDKVDVNEENVAKASIYANECGNVYTSTSIFYFCIFLLMMLNIGEIGVFKTIGTLVLLPLMLFINMLNKRNPFKMFQSAAIAQPGEKEIKLALAVYEKLMED